MEKHKLNQNAGPITKESLAATTPPKPELHNPKFDYQLTLSGPNGAEVDFRWNSEIPIALHPLLYCAGWNGCKSFFENVIATAFNAATGHVFQEREPEFYDEGDAVKNLAENMQDSKKFEAFTKANNDLMRRLGMLDVQQKDREAMERVQRKDQEFRRKMKLKMNQKASASHQPACDNGDASTDTLKEAA